MKKKFYYAGMLAAGLLTFASCNNDDDPIIDQNQVQTEVEEGQVIRIAVANTGDGLETRAGRPLVSEDAAQDIDKVKVAIVNITNGRKNAMVSLIKDISSWMEVSEDYSDDGQGKQYAWKLSKEETLPEGKYLAYAIGYTSNGSIYTMQSSVANGAYWESIANGNVLEWVKASVSSMNDEKQGEEIFAGEIELQVNSDGEFVMEENDDNVLTLHRQVTGVLGYFTNVPAYPLGKRSIIMGTESEPSKVDANDYAAFVKGLKLRLVVSDRNDVLKMTAFNSDFRASDAEGVAGEVDYLVNGAKSSDDVNVGSKVNFYELNNANTGYDALASQGYIAYTIKLGDWFDRDLDNDATLGASDAVGDNWRTPSALTNSVNYKDGTVFAGQFLIPFLKVADQPTMQLQLIADESGLQTTEDTPTVLAKKGDIIRVWDIKLAESDPQIVDDQGGRHIYLLDETGVPVLQTPQELEENRESYSLVRNHLYTIGRISADNNVPEDLSKGQTLMLRVNDNWEMIHQMVVE